MAILARFRPIAKKNRRLEQAPLEDRRTIDEIYDHDMNQRLWNQYRGTVVPYQKEAENPYRHATPWEKERYEHSRKELAHWALKQIGQDQLKDFVRRRRQDSSALDLVATSTGMPKEDDASGRKVETHAAHIRPAQAAAAAPQSEDEEPSTPTRLKAHLNVLKVRGQLTFTNPVITTSVEAKAGSRDDNLSLEMNREFHEIEMNSKVRYGVDQAVLLVNVNKRITDEVSVDLNSERWTGSRRGASGEKKREEAKVTYSLSF